MAGVKNEFASRLSPKSQPRKREKIKKGKWEIYTLWISMEFSVIVVEKVPSLPLRPAAKVRWPDLFDGVDSVLEDWIVDQMHIYPQLLEEPLKLIRDKLHNIVRPVVETGYENLLLVRLLVESRLPSIRKSSISFYNMSGPKASGSICKVAEGLTVEDILENWSKIKPVIMEEWDENRDALIDLFGKVRDEWMDNDIATWIGANRFYPGVPDALKFSSSTIYIVTTKQSRFADALLRELAGVTIPPERIYGLGTGPKVKVLKQLQLRPEHQGMKLHFVEDRLATLKNVIKEPELDGWNLYLGDWGYNTQKEREEAANISRIQLLELSDFSKKLK
ncbi:hypothetical protein CXB51_021672 [Gossypium anomalum]|uniref:Uncharacterized protein n=1 Tax=Gossypium anomalum TaxID=47600 RepID=A0A8J6CWS6_9ROSI|nr:hypothetical protein CXB51_021672 [Gossypium anomalum]